MQNMNEKIKTFKWNSVEWSLVEARIRKIQCRIYTASKAGRKERVNYLQNIIIRSLDAKLLAVKRVTTEATGKKTPGIDLETALTPEKKMDIVRKLEVDGKAAPIRRIYIPKPGKSTKRPLGIPIIKDRAKQKLVLLALEPEWEAKFEAGSYGFRPGRSCHDAIEKIFLSLRNNTGKVCKSSKYVLDADLKGCFDNIDHDYMINQLNTTLAIKRQVRAWLEAGIFEGRFLPEKDYEKIEKNTLGTPQGGVISPFLSNVALHGMENHLKSWITSQQWHMESKHENYTVNKKKSITIVRYADDFVVIHKDRNVIMAAKAELETWFGTTSKLKFNEEKTRIVESHEGFKFLGFDIINLVRNKRGRIKIIPSKEKQSSIIKNIGDITRNNRAISAYSLISILRPKLLGWANYFKFSECQLVFSKIDREVFNILRAWVFRRDRRNNRTDIKNKYFPPGKIYTYNGKKYKNNWILNGQIKTKGGDLVANHLPKISWIASEKFVMVKGDSSVYDPYLSSYWSLRTAKYGNFGLRQRTLLKNQGGNCTWCGSHFDSNMVDVDHIIPKYAGGKDEYKNLQLLHRICHTQKTAQDLLSPELQSLRNLLDKKKKDKEVKLGKVSNLIQEPDDAKVSCPDL